MEIRHARHNRRLFGYDRDATEGLLDEVRASFEVVWRERADLTEEVERLEGELARFRELEVALRTTLVSAERGSDELKAQAGREAELMLDTARLNAREITTAAENERERLHTEIRRLRAVETDMCAGYRAFVLCALDRLEGEMHPRETSERAA